MPTRTAHKQSALIALICSAILLCTTLALSPAAYASEDDSKFTSIESLIQSSVRMVKSSSFADEARAGDFYFAQSGSGRCTIASVAMMLRRAAYLDGSEGWSAIDEATVSADGWCAAGVKNEFASAGYAVELVGVEGSAEALAALLAEHPEGIAAYDPRVPHAILLTDYDAESGTFYCADPAGFYAGKRIALADSWNGSRHGSDQASTIAGFSSAWVIRK